MTLSMNRIKLILLLFIITFFSCERDDICIDETTPRLIIVFYGDEEFTTRKSVPNLKIEVDSLGVYNEISFSSYDSIAIPLRVDENLTNIRLIKNYDLDNEIIENFTLTYLRDEVFVSRSCGFKTTFLELPEDIEFDGTWIRSDTINTQNILNEKTKHISIFH